MPARHVIERYGRAALTTRRLTPGSLTTFDATHVHEVRNEGAVPAISIHVYTPSLDNMTFYPDTATADLARLAARVGSWW